MGVHNGYVEVDDTKNEFEVTLQYAKVIQSITISFRYCSTAKLLDKPTYRIAGKFGEDFNLAVWRIVKNRQIKFSLN